MAQQRSEPDSSTVMTLALEPAQKTEDSEEPGEIQEDGVHVDAVAS